MASSNEAQGGGRVAEWRTYARLFPFMRPWLGTLMFVLIVSLASTALTLAQPYLTKLLIDDALVAGDMDLLVQLAAAMVAVTIAGFGLNILASYRYVSASASILFAIRSALLRHLQALSPRFFSGFRLGDLMSRLNNDVSAIQRVTSDSFLSVLSNVLMLVGCMALMLLLDGVMFLISVVLIPACAVTFAYFQKKLTLISREMRERGADIGSMLVDSVMGMRVVAAFRAGDYEIRRFERHNGAFVGALLRMQVAAFTAGALPGTLLTVSTSAVIVYGGTQIIAGDMTIGTLVAFMTYHMRLFGPVQALMALTTSLATARVSLARVFELFDIEPEVREVEGPKELSGGAKAIRFDNVSLRHGGRDLVKDLSFEIPVNSFCAILGESGVGKSTVADLMVRFLDPDAGRVLIGSDDLRELKLSDLRREIILVDQTPYLFNASIRANIGFAKEQASAGDIDGAAKAAGLGGLLARLPEGLDTQVGERGLSVSAGERQRIALARALLCKPSILILDEPTSALDRDTAAVVTDGIRLALPNATLVVITHDRRLSDSADLTIDLGKSGDRRRSRVCAQSFSEKAQVSWL